MSKPISPTKRTFLIENDSVPFISIFFLLSCFVALFFINVLISGKSIFGHDVLLQFLPWKNLLYDFFHKNFRVPLWNPFQFSGSPFISNIQVSFFYPLGILYYIIRPETAYLYSTLLHCLLGSIFMTLFLHSLGVKKTGSLVSAIIFSYNGYFLAHLYAGHLSFAQNYIWLPLIFFFVFKFQQTLNFKHAVAAGLVLGIQILGGFPQIAFYTILSIILFIIYNISIELNQTNPGDICRSLFGLFIIIVIGFSLSAIQLLPTYEFTQLSTRGGGIRYDFATYESLHPKEILAFILPDIFGSAVDNTYWRSNECWHFWESCGYVGILPLLLVFIKAETRQLKQIKLFFFLLAIIALFLALGKYNPVYPLIYNLPGFGQFRIPAQILFLYVFSIAVIAGIGFHHVLNLSFQFNKSLYPFICIAGVVFLTFLTGFFLYPVPFAKLLIKLFSSAPVAIKNTQHLYERLSFCISKGNLLFFSSLFLLLMKKKQKLSSSLFSGIGILIVLLDLYLFGNQFIKSYDLSSPKQKNMISEQLPDNPTQGRVLPETSIFNPNDPTLYEFPSILGYDPLILRKYVNYIQFSQNLPFDDHVVNLTGMLINPNAKLIKLLNTKKMMDGFYIKELINEYQYANFANQFIVKPSEEILPFMNSEKFDPRKIVVFEQGCHTPKHRMLSKQPVNGRIKVLAYHHDNILIQTNTDNPCFLVISEIYYPGWKAELDGKPVDIFCGNYIFRSIFLPKGIHEVRFYFDPVSLKLGAIWSILTLIVSLFIIKFGKTIRFSSQNAF